MLDVQKVTEPMARPVKPFLKWAGGKYRVLQHIMPYLPHGARLVEPFAGSAAVWLNTIFPEALVCDRNTDLINIYRLLQQQGEAFIQYCRDLFQPEFNTREAYATLRDEFNHISPHAESEPETMRRAGLFLYLNRHAYNGLVRYNSRGAFNVPFGRYAKPRFPLEEMHAFHHHALAAPTRFLALGFEEAFALLQPGDVVYCDPPYDPLSATAAFTTYDGRAFTPDNQRTLASLALKAAQKGISVILSNHDTPFVRELYQGARLVTFEVRRFISCDGNRRGTAPELLAIYG